METFFETNSSTLNKTVLDVRILIPEISSFLTRNSQNRLLQNIRTFFFCLLAWTNMRHFLQKKTFNDDYLFEEAINTTKQFVGVIYCIFLGINSRFSNIMIRNLAFALAVLQAEAFVSPKSGQILLTKPRRGSVPLLSSIASTNDQKLEVNPPPSTSSTTSETDQSLNIRIHGEWYDLTKWRKSHPAGEHWIDLYNNRDATEVMDAFHSEKAKMMYQRLQKVDETKAIELEKATPEDTEVTLAFREFRTKLVKDGWFERDLVHEAKLIGINLSLFIGAAVSAHSIPLLSIFLLSLGK